MKTTAARKYAAEQNLSEEKMLKRVWKLKEFADKGAKIYAKA